MMNLSTIPIGVMGALLCSFAAPAAAAEREKATVASPGHDAVQASRSRRVELPFQLDFRPSEDGPHPPAPRGKADLHPYRDLQLEQPLRAGLDTGRTVPARRSLRVFSADLSWHPGGRDAAA